MEACPCTLSMQEAYFYRPVNGRNSRRSRLQVQQYFQPVLNKS